MLRTPSCRAWTDHLDPFAENEVDEGLGDEETLPLTSGDYPQLNCALGFEPIPTGPLPPGTAGAPPLFVPVEPPPLAPGMTEPIPPPEPAHMNQLRLLRLE